MKRDLRTKAHLLLQKKRFKDAEKAYKMLLRSFPNDPDILYSIGIVASELNDYASAIQYLLKALQVQPMHGMALHRLANILLELKTYIPAEMYFKNAIRVCGNNHVIYTDYAKLLRLTGRSAEAEKYLAFAIRLEATHAPAYHELGEIFLARKDYQNAANKFERALATNHGRPYTHECLGDCYFGLGYLEKATNQYRQAIKQSKRRIRPLLRLGSILLLHGKATESENCYRRVLRIDKTNTEALVGIAEAQLQNGLPNEALNTLSPLLDNSIINDGLSRVYTNICLKLGTPKQAIKYLQSSLNKKDTHEHMVHTYYALGKLEDTLNNYDTAFKYYEKANKLISYSYDAAGHAKATDSLINTFSRATIHTLPRAKHKTRRPIFIVGMPRSGTTLLEQIITSLPGVYGAGELITLSRIAASIQNRDNTAKTYPESIPDITQDLANKLSNEYLNELQEINTTAERVTDKMPHNFVHLGLIELLFPQATVVHCIRNPLDTCLSIYFQKFNATHTYANDLNDLGMHYRQYLRLMNHWKQVLTIPIYDVHYEDLVSDLEGTSKKIAEYCDLTWDRQCLQYFKSGRFVNTASNEQVNKAIYSDSVDRWRHYVKHIKPLISLLGAR